MAMMRLSVAMGSAVAVALATADTPAMANTLVTPLGGTQLQGGVMFDVVVARPIILESLSFDVTEASNDYELYARAGSITGSEADPAAWSLLASFANVTGNAPGGLTLFDITDLPLAVGTYGLYFTGTAGTPVRSNLGSSLGSIVADSGNAAILTGYGIAYAFGDNIAPRNVVTQLNYTVVVFPPAVPEPTSWALLIAGFGLTGAALRWRRGSLLRHDVAS